MDVNFSFSIGGVDEPPKAKPLWAFCGVDIIPAPDEAVLLRRRDDDKRHFVRRDVAAVLDACKTFKTLEEHALAAGDVIPELKGHPEHALPVLQQMADAGFLRNSQSLVDRWRANQGIAPSDPPKVFIITCDRPAAVERLLDSLAANDQNAAYEITVIDDSRDQSNQTANANLVTQWQEDSRLNVSYFGLEARSELLNHLIQALPDCEAEIRFLIDRNHWSDLPTYGLSRNLALLLSVGHRLVILDDDILASALPAPQPSQQLRLGVAGDRDLAVFSSQVALLEENPAREQSPIALTAEILGGCLGDISGEKSLTGADLLEVEAEAWWSLPGDAPIVMTQCGCFGDPGTGNNANWVVNLKAPDLATLFDAGEDVEATLEQRALWVGYSQPTLMRFGVMSGLTGLDNRNLLPPHLPVLRGEDFLFAVMLEKMLPEGVVLGHEWGIPHFPIDERGRPEFSDQYATRANLGVLARWLDKQPVRASSDRANQLLQLAEHVRFLANLEESEQLAALQSALAGEHLQQLATINRAIADAAQFDNASWEARLDRHKQELLTALQNPIDQSYLQSDKSAAASITMLSQRGVQFASAMENWSQIIAASQSYTRN